MESKWYVRLGLTILYFGCGISCLRDNDIFLGAFYMICVGNSIAKIFDIIKREVDEEDK